MGRVHEHSVQEKAKARKSGPSVRQKTEDLGRLANIFAATVHWDPTHLCFRAAVHLPEGETVPDMNQLIADALAGRNSQQAQRQRRRQLQSKPFTHREERQQALRRSTWKRGAQRSAPRTSVDLYDFPDSSADEAEPATRDSPGGSSGRRPSVSNSVRATESHDLAEAPEHTTDDTTVPIVDSIEPTELGPSQNSGAADISQLENDMAWIRDTSFDFSTDLLTDFFANDGAVERQSTTPGPPRTQANPTAPPKMKDAPTRPVPGTAWRRLARDSLMLLDNILSSHTRKAPLPGRAADRALHSYQDRKHVH
ncbi:hypothetical protein Purlil1_12567 [Purpureocillium lilacinum]|uniref:Uncharacterized protein n=1 Tax=Purpureocillium lilacinum TaxID=33203 RepID=A0ABR0BH33_PURLI|nr:hypothetical protein Purlil1_12567 [Purpureocillium lilacinum]